MDGRLGGSGDSGTTHCKASANFFAVAHQSEGLGWRGTEDGINESSCQSPKKEEQSAAGKEMIEGGEEGNRGSDQLELLALTAGIQNAGEICRYESDRKHSARGFNTRKSKEEVNINLGKYPFNILSQLTNGKQVTSSSTKILVLNIIKNKKKTIYVLGLINYPWYTCRMSDFSLYVTVAH